RVLVGGEVGHLEVEPGRDAILHGGRVYEHPPAGLLVPYDDGRQSNWLTPEARSSRSGDHTCWWVASRPSAPEGDSPRTNSGDAPGAMRWNSHAMSSEGA